MRFDRQITISAGASRRAVSWQPQTLLLSELYTRLATPVRGTETRDSYQDDRPGGEDWPLMGEVNIDMKGE